MTTTEMVVVGILMIVSFVTGRWLFGLVFMGYAMYMLFRVPEGS